jgi:hypothetical protein
VGLPIVKYLPFPEIRVLNTLSNIWTSLPNGRPNRDFRYWAGQLGVEYVGRPIAKYLRFPEFRVLNPLSNTSPDLLIGRPNSDRAYSGNILSIGRPKPGYPKQHKWRQSRDDTTHQI